MKSVFLLPILSACFVINACSPKNTSAVNPDKAVPVSSAGMMGLCIKNANYYTQDGALALVDISINNGKIVNIAQHGLCGDNATYKQGIVDLKGAYAYPGFVDAHAHLLGIGLREMTLNLEGAPSIKALVETLAQSVAQTPKGETIYGRGWIETHWPENRFPTRMDLDAVSPDNPVILQRADGHAIVANSKALVTAGIDKDTKAPFGGKILLGKDGEPTGMLIDKAMSLVTDLLADVTPERRRAAYIKASEVYAAHGWTGIQSMSVVAEDVDLIAQLSDDGLLKIRVYNAVDMEGADALLDGIAASGPKTSNNGRVVTRAIKLYADGALGSRGAALLEPYADEPDNKGLMLTTREKIMPILERSLRDGIQISTHAIGDRANRLVLDWYAEAFAKVPVAERKFSNPRWRIEHAQILNMADLKRFSELGVIASMQPSHAIGDLHFAVNRLGVERLRGGYAWNSLIESGVKIAAGSDAPVERGDPRIEFYAAVARKDMKGFSTDGWYPSEAVSRERALEMLTAWPAYAAFSEEQTGLIAIGQNADFTIFDQDIMTIDEANILKVKPVMTIVDGEIVYQASP
ncbi:MAG: amidohydrolase [Robiginitomaculum sp.]|nr:amidohydrolase [Robiginitomaculum sp.]